MRLLPRLFRRHELPLYYSLGFHQKPVIVFGPALSLGISSLSEYVDLKLAGVAPDCDALPGLLSNASIDGVRFLSAAILGPDDPKLSRVIDHAEYVAGLPRAALAELGLHDADALAAKIAAARQTPLIVRRDIEGIGKRVDVGEFLVSAEVGAGAEALERGGHRRRSRAGHARAAHHGRGHGEGERSDRGAARQHRVAGALRADRAALHEGWRARDADGSRRSYARRSARCANRRRAPKAMSSQSDVLKSLLRSTALSALARVKASPVTAAVKSKLAEVSFGRIVIADEQLTSAVARVARVSEATVRSGHGLLRIDVRFEDGRALLMALRPDGIAFAPFGPKELAFAVEPAGALRAAAQPRRGRGDRERDRAQPVAARARCARRAPSRRGKSRASTSARSSICAACPRCAGRCASACRRC